MPILRRHEQHIATALAKQRAIDTGQVWTVADSNDRITPCDHWVPNKTGKGGKWVPCATPVRVKIKEPGVHDRHCPQCSKTVYYELTPISGQDMKLRMVWVDEARAREVWWGPESTATLGDDIESYGNSGGRSSAGGAATVGAVEVFATAREVGSSAPMAAINTDTFDSATTP